MTILTQNQMRQSIADAFSRSVESAYKDLLDAAVRAEREACAKVCDEVHARHIAEHGDYIDETYATECAAAIRARGEQP